MEKQDLGVWQRGKIRLSRCSLGWKNPERWAGFVLQGVQIGTRMSQHKPAPRRGSNSLQEYAWKCYWGNKEEFFLPWYLQALILFLLPCTSAGSHTPFLWRQTLFQIPPRKPLPSSPLRISLPIEKPYCCMKCGYPSIFKNNWSTNPGPSPASPVSSFSLEGYRSLSLPGFFFFF